jgi:hypothetical protein
MHTPSGGEELAMRQIRLHLTDEGRELIDSEGRKVCTNRIGTTLMRTQWTVRRYPHDGVKYLVKDSLCTAP